MDKLFDKVLGADDDDKKPKQQHDGESEAQPRHHLHLLRHLSFTWLICTTKRFQNAVAIGGDSKPFFSS